MLRSGIIYDKFHKQLKNLKTKISLADKRYCLKDTLIITSSGSFKSKRVFSSLLIWPLLTKINTRIKTTFFGMVY